MDKIEMPEEWEKIGDNQWRRGSDYNAPLVAVFGMDTPYASADGQIHHDLATALRDAQTLARALTPGWVVVREGERPTVTPIDILASILHCPPAELIGAVKALISDRDDWRRREGEARAAKERAEVGERNARASEARAVRALDAATALLKSARDSIADLERENDEARTLANQLRADLDAALLRLGRASPPPSLARRVLRRVLG